ncbi:unnamed protein product [Mytilus coruscus]|uniref:Endonuclease n=1 Tax=Mytilus coruscus TaxID=42192 RepID=A0A6J8BWZ8_MYTCO|nr:unnamed protein product [Mytilus coruscus]
MHSTPKISTNAQESDSGVETAIQTNPLRSDEAGHTVIFSVRSKVTSENDISTNSETLPYSNSLDRNSGDKQGHISQPLSTNMPLSNSRNSNWGILIKIKQSRPKSLDEAVKLSVELEAFNKAEELNRAYRGYLRSADYNSIEEENELIPGAAPDTNTAVEKLEQGMQSIQNMIKKLTIEMCKLKDGERSRGNLTNDKKCYNCGKSGNFVRECPQRKPHDNSFHRGRGGGYNRPGRGDRYQNPRSNDNGSSRVIRKMNNGRKPNVSIVDEAGMYIEVHMNNKDAKFLVNTGAILSIISSSFYYQLNRKPILEKCNKQITSANGGLLSVKGKGTFNVRIGDTFFRLEAVVADIRADGILELDFLKDNDCVIDVVAKKLIVSGIDYPVQFEGKIGCYRIVASETISMPPVSEMVISCVVCVPKGQTMKHFEGIVEPLENKLEQDGPLVARTLVNTDDQGPIRLINLCKEVQVIHKGTSIGQVHAVISISDQKQHNSDPEISLRPDLQNLLKKIKYKESFAETDKDLGRTTLIKHKINTRDAPAFKEPPRRTPCHDNKTSAHLGVRKTIERIRQKYYWPGLQADVRRYIIGCEFCNRRKNPCQTNKAPMQLVQSCHPMERIAADILGELPETDNGNWYILVVSDYFSKWTESFAMPNMEAVTVANLIVEQVVARFGVPSYLHSYQGRQFESNLFSEMCRMLNIKKTRTTSSHPQSDGQVECFNKTLETMLSTREVYRCDQRGKTQIIHVDRMRKRNPQILEGESVEPLEPPETLSDTNEKIVEREPEVLEHAESVPVEGGEQHTIEDVPLGKIGTSSNFSNWSGRRRQPPV